MNNAFRAPHGLLKSFTSAFSMILLTLSSLLFAQDVDLIPLGTYETGIYADGAAEIVDFDALSQRLFVVNGAEGTIDALDIADPANPQLAFSIDLSPYGKQANSVAVFKGLVAAAVENNDKQAPGVVVFFDNHGSFINQVTVGSLPDMLTFTPNGKAVVVANEGEPNDDYTIDPEGSISIIDLTGGAAYLSQADVHNVRFNGLDDADLSPSVRIFGPGASIAQDLEPEYVAIDKRSQYAYVTLQENNALAVVDIRNAELVEVRGFGFKDHSLEENAFDASNEDGGINIQPHPTHGMFQPDAIGWYRVHGKEFLVTANEGDSREYEGTPGFVGETRVKDIALDPLAFPDAENLQAVENLGRLKVTLANGDLDKDGDFERLYSYGTRSFSIWDTEGRRVFDSGKELEQITAALAPDGFNSDDEENTSMDDRSDDKGPEPEGLTIAKIDGRQILFLGLERIGGIMIYDITDPEKANFIQYVNTRNFNGDPAAGTAGDLSPEGLVYIPKSKSPNNRPLLAVAYEVSGTTTIYEIRHRKSEVSAYETIDDGLSVNAALLEQNYPNPFNPTTEIRFNLPKATSVKLTVFDLLGRQVVTLADGMYSTGSHVIQWDGKDRSGQLVGSGVYLYKLQTADNVSIRRMTLMQ